MIPRQNLLTNNAGIMFIAPRYKWLQIGPALNLVPIDRSLTADS